MKVLIVLSALMAVAYAIDGACYKDVVQACKPNGKASPKAIAGEDNCNARYGGIDNALPHLQAYVNTHITRSFEYLLMATHFGNYEKQREGFQKLFMGFSDAKWEQAIDLIKFVAKRGGRTNFAQLKDRKVTADAKAYELYELESMAKALDMEKELTADAFGIHLEASNRNAENHDPEITSYIEKEFLHKHADNIRKLSGYTSDLYDLMKTPDRALGIFTFDKLLQG